MDYDEVLKQLGEFGPYQRKLLALSLLPIIYNAFGSPASNFFIGNHLHRCKIPGLSNDTYAIQDNQHAYHINETIPVTEDGAYDPCHIIVNGSRKPCDEWVFDQSVFKNTVNSQFQIVCQKKLLLPHATMTYFFGFMVSAATMCPLSDLIGRRLDACIALTLCFVANVLMPFSVDVYMFAVLRFFDGFFGMAIYTTIFLIGIEMVGPSKRQIIGTLILLAFCVGEFILVLLAYFIRDWRWLQLTLAIPMGISNILWWPRILPESPRWLLSRNRKDEALKIIRRAAKVNKVNLSDEIKAIRLKAEKDKGIFYIFKQLIRSRVLVLRWIISFFNWFVISFIYYGIQLNIGFFGSNVYTTFLINVVAETIGYSLVLLIDRTGRRKLYLITMFSISVVCVASVIVTMFLDKSLRWITVSLAMIGKLLVSLAFGVVYVYTGELFPTVVRGFVIGISSFGARLGSLITPYLYYLTKMPKSKNWKRSAVKRRNTHASRLTIDKTEDPALVKNRTDDLEDPALVKNRSDCAEDPALIKNRSKIELSNELSEMRLRAPNGSSNMCHQAPNEISEKIEIDSNETQCVNDESLINDTLFASHNQADLRYSMLSRGNQCTCMSLSVVVAMQENDQLSASFLDQVLYEGDNLYKKVVMDLKREGRYVSSLLSFNELPSALEYRGKYYSINQHSSIYGVSIVENNTETLSLHEGIIFGLAKSQHLLIMYGALCSAIMFIDGKYLFFDSHSHGDDGLSAPDGKSMLKVFSSIDNLIAFLYSFYTSCNIDLHSQFEILPVVVNLIQHDFLREQLSSYQTGQAESHGSKSNERNCQSRNKNSEQYIDIKRQRNLHVDRKLKANIRYREKELLGKRKVIDDETFYDKDVANKRKNYMKDYMQKRRKCPKFKLQEARAKREARCENEYRQNERERELSAKRKSRNDVQYKQNELSAKRMKRSDVQYRNDERKRELSAKRKSRDDEQFRQRELTAKRKSRDDEQFRQRELSEKRIKREDEQYKKNELSAKRMKRSDVQYRNDERKRELSAKRKSRDDEQFRQRELTSKRTKREDEQYKQNELSAKRMKRGDMQYRNDERKREVSSKKFMRKNRIFRLKERLIELQSKRKARKNKIFLEAERLKKRQQRKSKTDKTHLRERESDKNRKINNRSIESYKKKEKDIVNIKKYGSNIMECIIIFHACTSSGPIYVCSVCHQTWFCDSVHKVVNITKVDFKPGILTGLKSAEDKEWICRTCLSNVKNNKVPKVSVLNGMKWPDQPPELKLHPMEERVIALRIPFMQMRELPRGGQFCVKGNVINVPVDIQPTIKALPRQVDETCTIPVKLKKKMTYKKVDFTENIRPAVVLSALHWLMSKSELYKDSGVNIDNTWENTITSDCREIVQEFLTGNSTMNNAGNGYQENTKNSSEEVNEHVIVHDKDAEDETGYESDSFSEIDSNENVTGNADTLLEDEALNTDKSYTFAPGEGQHPLSLFIDKDAEFLSFPTIYCGQRRLENKERLVPVHYSDIAKWELRSVDRRAARSVPNIFFKLKKIQLKQISDKVQLAVRRIKTKGKK